MQANSTRQERYIANALCAAITVSGSAELKRAGQGRAGQSHSELAPEVARQHTGHRGHDDEQPEGGTGGHHLLKEVEHPLRQVQRQDPIRQHVHEPQNCTTHRFTVYTGARLTCCILLRGSGKC